MTPQEKALLLISRIEEWELGDPTRFSEAGTTEKAKMIARWGMEGKDQMLESAVVTLFPHG
jgi:hypothetical protein